MEPAIFGPLDTFLAPVIEDVIFVLVLVNLGTRLVAHRSYLSQAEAGAESVSRHLGHEASNVVLMLASFYFLTLHHHAGIVLSTLVIGMIITDFFEFESRQVEVRNDLDLERPKGAMAASILVVAYAFFLSLFSLIQPYWDAII